MKRRITAILLLLVSFYFSLTPVIFAAPLKCVPAGESLPNGIDTAIGCIKVTGPDAGNNLIKIILGTRFLWLNPTHLKKIWLGKYLF